ncbi:MAG: hypothetical protein SWY16_17295 [Cyanobacteriota bacterium]|nr:hypothetical protein [Cyanobacteriota bacterium]
MPASSSRYQSRFLNFIVEQSQKLTDRTALTFRQLKVATIWGIQTVAYPFYALAQAVVETMGRRLGSAAKSQPVLEEPATSELTTPIDRILAEVRKESASEPDRTSNPWSQVGATLARFLRASFEVFKPEKSSSDTNDLSVGISNPKLHLPTSETVRGIASSLSNRRLVLVSPENQIFDGLSLERQNQIERRILAEIADREPPQQIPSKPIVNPAENLADETDTNPNSLASQLSDLETRHRASWEKVQKLTQSSKETLQATFQSTFSNWFPQTDVRGFDSDRNAVEDPWTSANSKGNYPVSRSANIPLKPNQPISFKILPQPASVETPKKKKFLDFVKTNLAALNNSSLVRSSESSENFDSIEIPKPSLAEDLTTLIRGAIDDITRQIDRSTLTPSTENDDFNFWQQFPVSNLSPTQNRPNETLNALVKTLPEAIQNWQESTQESAFVTPSKTSSSSRNEWIETTVTSMGYAKSFLDRALEWLDSAVFWLEEQLLKLWQQVRQL